VLTLNSSVNEFLGLITIDQAPVVQGVDGAIHWMNLYPVDNTIGFPITCPLGSDLSGGWRYSPFEQLAPVLNPKYCR